MSRKRAISRRTVIRGMGTAMALPLLDAMAPAAGAARATSSPPVRAAFLYVPNGVILPHWTPSREGTDFVLPKTLAPLKAAREDLLVLSGLAHDKARANGDGAGDHARSGGTFLTGMQCRKTSGRDIQAGISVDQVAAQAIGERTRLPSLELGTEPGRQSGNCDSGYSCAYSSNISWRSAETPMAKEINPRSAFDRLFGDEQAARSRREAARALARRQSILDLVRTDAGDLRRRVGRSDQQKLDEYLDSVRALEHRLQTSEKEGRQALPPGAARPDGIPRDYAQHVQLMTDMMVLAFQSDSTRIATFMYANAGSNRSYPSVGVRGGHHSLSHHRDDPNKVDHLQRIDQFHIQQFARMLERMKQIREGEGTLLDNSLVLYGCAIGDGNRHSHHDLPVLLAGRGGGSVTTGRHVRYGRDTPLCNLFLSVLDRVGAKPPRFGDSTGRLGNLKV